MRDDMASRQHREQLVGGKYRLIRPLAEGGYGRVVLARQVEKGVDLGEVVLKFLRWSRASDGSSWQRISDEIRAARKVNSPHAVKIYGSGEDDQGIPFLVMEYLEGRTLKEVLSSDGPLDPGRTLLLGIQVASALEACHERGILHLDLKPDNLLLLGKHEDFVKVIDFGIARMDSAKDPPPDGVIGTPGYMSPEHLRGEELDEGADIYALGIVLHECLTGRTPETGQPGVPMAELSPALPQEFTALLQRLVSPDRAARPASMADVERRLRQVENAGGLGGAAISRQVADPVPALTLPQSDEERLGQASPSGRFRISSEMTGPTLLVLLCFLGLVAAWSFFRLASAPTTEQTAAPTVAVLAFPEPRLTNDRVAGRTEQASSPKPGRKARPGPVRKRPHARRRPAKRTPASPMVSRPQGREIRTRLPPDRLTPAPHNEPLFPVPPPLGRRGNLDRYGARTGGL